MIPHLLPYDLSQAEFCQRLIDAGWKPEDALAEWYAIQYEPPEDWEGQP